MGLFRKYILRNLHLKLAALGLSALLWSAIANEPRVEVLYQSPLEFRNMPQNLEPSTEVPTMVQIRVSGPASAVREISGPDLAVVLNLDGFDQPGERTYPLTVSDVHIPFGVKVMQIIPAQVRVRFEARLRRSVPVTPRFVGSFAPGYQLASFTVTPSEVTAVGPEGHVSVVESATTDPIDVTGVIARSQFWTNTFIPDPLVRIQSNPTVRVTIHMRKLK